MSDVPRYPCHAQQMADAITRDADCQHMMLMGFAMASLASRAAIDLVGAGRLQASLPYQARSYTTWMDQRKLEYAFRLRRMQAGRLPRQVAAAAWPVFRGQRHDRLHADLVLHRPSPLTLGWMWWLLLPVVCPTPLSRRVWQAACASVICGQCGVLDRQSTVSRYLRILDNPAVVPNQLQDYMSGPMSSARKALLLCRAGALHTARRLCQRKVVPSPACVHCRSGEEDTLEHAVLLWPAFADMHVALWDSVVECAGQAAADAVSGMPPAQRLEALLGGHQWGGHTLAVQEVVGRSLAGLLAARAQRGAGAVERQPAAVVAAARAAALSEPDTACQCCQARFSVQHHRMLLCDGCEHGYHQSCLQVPLRSVPAGPWLCPGGVAQQEYIWCQ
jgi:hypothetical protein